MERFRHKINNRIRTIFQLLLFVCAGTIFSQESLQLDTLTLHNGLKVYLLQYGEDSVLSMRLVMHAGKKDEGPCEVGYSEIIQRLFEETLKEKQRSVPRKKNRLTCEVREGETLLRVNCSKKELGKKMELLSSTVLRLPFKKVKIDPVVYSIVDQYKQENISPSRLAEVFRDLLLYGPKESRGRNYCQYQSEKVIPEELREFYFRHYSPKRSSLLICGNFNVAEVKKLIGRHLGKWRTLRKEGKLTDDQEPKTPKISSKEIVFVHKRNAKHCLLKWVHAAPSFRSPDHAAFLLSCELFEQYLAKRTKEAHGNCDSLKFGALVYTPPFREITCLTGNGDMSKAMRLYDTILESFYHFKFVETDLEAAVQNLKDRYSRNKKPEAVLAFYDPLVYDLNVRRNFLSSLHGISIRDIQRVQEAYFDPNSYTLIIVDKETEASKQLIQGKHVKKFFASDLETCSERCVPIKKRWKPHDEQPRLFCRECWRLGRFWGKNRSPASAS